MVVVWVDLPSVEPTKNQILAVLDAEGVQDASDVSYPATGLMDWTPLAQEVIGSGASSMYFLGEPTNLGALVRSLREQGWEGVPVLVTNHYDPLYPESAGAVNAAGSVIRSQSHPFEEADQWPAVERYVEILEDYSEDPKIAVLGLRSFSAWLLFVEAARACGQANDTELTRACVLEAAVSLDGWTGGGLHSPTDPEPEGGREAECEMLLQVTDAGGFERLWPEVGGEDDDGGGFKCHGDAVVQVPVNEGLGKIGEEQPV
jgi:hypothetical protein